jgi:uncharacterized membrane protein
LYPAAAERQRDRLALPFLFEVVPRRPAVDQIAIRSAVCRHIPFAAVENDVRQAVLRRPTENLPVTPYITRKDSFDSRTEVNMSTEQIPPNSTFPLAPQNGKRYFPPAEKTEDGDIIGRSVQIIRQDAQALYALWSDLTSLPLWQEYVVSVTPLSERVSHWVMGDPDDADGKRVEFDSEITESLPGKKIAWRSISDHVKQSGVVTFEETPRGTRVTLVQIGDVPAGALGNAVAATLKRSPRQIVTEDLRHFKEFAETGEIPTVKGQPHGKRGISGTIKKWMYGENNPTPPGSSQQ